MGYNKCELSPSLQWGSEVFFTEDGSAGGYCGCSGHSYSLITQFAFSFTGQSGLARVTRCPREARASGKLLFLICPPGRSFGILRLVPSTYLRTMAGVAPTAKTSVCLPGVLGWSRVRHRWPLASFLGRVSECKGQASRWVLAWPQTLRAEQVPISCHSVLARSHLLSLSLHVRHPHPRVRSDGSLRF